MNHLEKQNKKLQEENTILKRNLRSINEIIYANNITIGSDDYFKIRELCTKHIKN